MSRILGTDPLIYLLIFLGLLFTQISGFLLRQALLMPLLNALVLWPFLIWTLRHARVDVAVRLLIFWAVILFLGAVLAGRVFSASAQFAVPGSIEYNVQQLQWIRGDVTPVEDPGSWLPLLMRRTGVLLFGGALSAGLIPLITGARALAILGLWTANLFNAPHIIAVFLGIPLWTWVEAAAQILLGAVLAEPILTGDVNALLTPLRRRLLLMGLTGLGLAALIHAFLAPLNRALLHLLLF